MMSFIQGLFLFAKKVALAVEEVVPCKRIGIAVIGLEVPHAHIHLVPLESIYDIDFKKPKLRFTQEEFAKLAAEISKCLQQEADILNRLLHFSPQCN